MKPDPQDPDEFAAVQKLLALKRHEEPPPGYFDRLPGEVRARIAHAQAHPEPWWRRWLAAWDVPPAIATSYAAVAVALVFGGVWVAKQSGSSKAPAIATTPARAADPTLTNVSITSNSAPPGLFNPPSLPVQPAEFKK